MFGIYAPEHDVARLAYFALFALQHRGQESAGIATAPRGGSIMAIRDQGLVAQVFDEHMLRSLVGDMAIGHVRYSTTGSSEWENAQPIVRDDHRTLALAHNGNLINAVELHSELRGRDVPFRSTSDSEIIAALLATHPAERIEDAVADVLPRLQGAFSTVVMTEDAVVAFRDPHGLRPLALGMIEDGGPGSAAYCVASESCAFDLIGARYLRDVEPGEVVTLTERRPPERGWSSEGARRAFCVFEYIYFARPDSRMAGTVLQVARAQDGRDPLARGAGRGRPRDPGPRLGQRRRPGPGPRRRAAAGRRLHQEPLRRADLHPARPGAAPPRPAAEVQPAARGRRPASGWSSSTTRSCAATPPARSSRCCARPARRRCTCASRRRRSSIPCHYGIDMSTREEMIAHGRSVEEIAAELGADSLHYLSLDGVYEAVGGSRATHCDACFSGEYPLDGTEEANGKFALESALPLVRA